MEDKLRLNTKLYGFDGIIGRRDFFLNFLIICAISLLFTMPYTIWLFANIETLFDAFNFSQMFVQSPVFLKIWIIFGTAGFGTLGVSNIFRRLNDINGDVNTTSNIIFSAIYLISIFGIILPFWCFLVFGTLNLILALVLLFKTGKITSMYPYDFTKEFNWGAFLGTWIWGLFNKSYKTLWIWILGLTPWGTYYALYCGLKGNEWAYKNKKWDDVDKFNTSQEKQATVFAVLTFLIVPVLYIALIFGITALLMFAVVDDAKTTPQGCPTKLEKLGDALDAVTSAYFEGHAITEKENKFYVNSSDWSGYSFSEKKDILDMAASMSANERRKASKAKNPTNYEYFSKTDELPRTKIYSAETKKLLGEFVMDEKVFENGSVKDIMKASFNAYHFYKD
ncbi:hypothetical protein IKQ21_02775 [bacterium]|nr:hypothetical protein [bacterium]